ncbi:hypothetical protein SCAR479_07165 [Seiridium cardinale]|uniref:Uncharacterized protein n=1 Tax=Seiridium cardinale TaxID=138064 RepID=A0ABR2XRE1_9PEZI
MNPQKSSNSMYQHGPTVPETLEDIQNMFRLPSPAEARELIHAEPIQHAFRQYLNRYMRSATTQPELLDDWKTVDDYLYTTKIEHKNSEQYMDEQCIRRPYDRLPHVALFVAKVMIFLKSEGRCFDSASVRWEQESDRDFGRCKRAVALLRFFLRRYEVQNPCHNVL